MSSPDKKSPAYPAWKIQADRCRAAYYESIETIERLTDNTEPTWACGTPMDLSDKRDMLKRARAIVAYGDEHWRDYLAD